MLHPVVELAECTVCESCVAVCPEVFRVSAAGGYIEVIELPAYPQERVAEAIRYCPERCITWEEG
ncbi:MAG: ferredoxin [Thermodesulfobacteriota bacterium]